MTAGHPWNGANGRIVGPVIAGDGAARSCGPAVGGRRSDVVVSA